MPEEKKVNAHHITLQLLRFFFILCCIGEKVKSCLCSINIIFKAFAIKLESLKIVFIVRTYGSLQYCISKIFSFLFVNMKTF